MSGGCSRFKQNAWKKEMCSNCYKTRDEHEDRPRPALPDLPLISPSQSILKGWDRDRKKKRKSVSFPLDECELIGYGGEELSSEDEPDLEEVQGSREESSEEPDADEERALTKLTKNNTDFNSVLGNLSGTKTCPCPAQNALPGGQKRDAIQVTVQPFSNNLANSRKIHMKTLLQDNAPTLTVVQTDKKQTEQPKEVETRRVNITRGSVITKNHESVKNKLYIQNILNGKNEKRNSYNADKVYITTSARVVGEDVSGNNKNCVVLNCNGVSLLGLDCEKDKVLMESREMAGEPDGRADSDEAEIPITPPPRMSFLHRDTPDTFETMRINTVETLHEVKRTVETVSLASPERIVIRKLSSENVRTDDVEPVERRVSVTPDSLRRAEPALRRLSDMTDSRSIQEDRRYSDLSELWHLNHSSVEIRRRSVTPEEPVRCTKRQAPKPPQCDSESEIEPETTTEPDERVVETSSTPVPTRPARPDSLKISVSSEEPVTPTSSPEPDKLDNVYEVRKNSPKREPPPLPPTTPEPRKSPPEPLPRHNKTTFIDVEKKKTKMKETLKKFLRLGTKEEMEVEAQSPRVRPHIIHPLDLNTSAVEVLPTANIIKCSSPETPSTPTPSVTACRPSKPPPPPRSESLNLMERLRSKPGSENNIYANLGEARSGMTPVKPVRTGSMREAAGKLTPVTVREPAVTVSPDQDNLYEAIGSASSAPECDMGHQTYYGSETESDTYSGTNFHECGDCEGRRGRLVAPYPTLEENFAAVSQLNLEAINHLLTKMLERDERSGQLKEFQLDLGSRRDVCRSLFVQAETRQQHRVSLAVTPPGVSLILPHGLSVISRFTDTLPLDLLPSTPPHPLVGEVTVLNCCDASRLTDSLTPDCEESTETRLMVLVQVLQIIGQIDSGQCLPDNFIALKDTSNRLSITYLHKASDRDESWKTLVDRLCDRLKLPDPLQQRLSTCQSDSEASLVVTCWLYGPPPSVARHSLQSWLALQRARALRCYLLSPHSTPAAQHVAFLASNIDLNLLYKESCLLQQPLQ